MFNFVDDDFNNFAKIKVIGVGEVGAKIINYTIENGIEGVELAAIDTNNKTLLKSVAPQRLKINDINSEETTDKIKQLINCSDMIYLVSDLENKNLLKKIAEVANDGKRLKICLIDHSDDELKNFFDTVIVIEDEDINLKYQAVRGVTDLIAVPGLVGLDFIDVKNVTTQAGEGCIGYGEASGENATFEATKKAIQLLNGKINKPNGMLINILGEVDSLSMMEVNEAINLIQEISHEDGEIVWGVNSDDTLEDIIKVVILATKFE